MSDEPRKLSNTLIIFNYSNYVMITSFIISNEKTGTIRHLGSSILN